MVSNHGPKSRDIYASGCELIEAGYKVFPLGNGKAPATQGAFYASTEYPEDLQKWISEGKRGGLAIATGLASGVVVIDADSPEAFQWMYERHGDAHVVTDRGGHWYFRHPGDGKVTCVSKFAHGLDRKGDGGYTAVPPSPRKEWTAGVPDRRTLPKLPAEFKTKKTERANTSERKLDPETFGRAVEIIAAHYPKPGEQQYDFGLYLSGYLQGNGLGEEDTYRLMWDALERQPGGTDDQAEHNITRVVESTAQKLADGEYVKGGPSVEKIAPGLLGELGPVLGFVFRREDFEGVPEVDAPETPREPRSYMLTDVGNGERFADEHGRNIRWVSAWNKHVAWTGRVWAEDTMDAATRKAQITAKGMFRDAMAGDADTDTQKKVAKHAIGSQSAPRIRAMLEMARNKIIASHEEFDPDPWLLNCQNGTIDLRTGELREHSRADLITKVTPVEYDPDADAPTFHAFLERILPSEELRGFLQRAFGMALSGEIRDNVLIILYGSGSNGKSTLMEVILEALGKYGKAAVPDLLMSKGRSHLTELADLFGARLVSCMESEEGKRLNEGLVKQLTGRDRISARRMREDPWEFEPTHSIFFGTNHKPEVRGMDHAIWRRLKLVPFEVKIPDAEQDKSLPEKLQAELPGILAWLVEGCLEWQRIGLQEPEEVTNATDEYRADMDLLQQFIEDCCVVHPDAEAPATALYKSYSRWAEEMGEKTPLKQRPFGQRLGDRGYTSFKFTSGPNKDRNGWRGIGLRSGGTDPDDDGFRGGGRIKSPSTYPKAEDERRNEFQSSAVQSGLDTPENPGSNDRGGGSGQSFAINRDVQSRVSGNGKSSPLPPLPPLRTLKTTVGNS